MLPNLPSLAKKIGLHGFVEDIRVTIIDRLIGRDRTRESFWQHKLDTFTSRGLNVKEVDA